MNYTMMLFIHQCVQNDQVQAGNHTITHGKVWHGKYKVYNFVFNKIYKGILQTVYAFVTKILLTSAQPIQTNDLSNIVIRNHT